jgi:transcriptional regulator with XRE-family HTH domain
MNQTILWGRTPTSSDLGSLVRAARKQAGLRQDELARELGVTRMTVSRMERGESVAVDTVIAALSLCGMTLVAVPKGAGVKVEA